MEGLPNEGWFFDVDDGHGFAGFFVSALCNGDLRCFFFFEDPFDFGEPCIGFGAWIDLGDEEEEQDHGSRGKRREHQTGMFADPREHLCPERGLWWLWCSDLAWKFGGAIA